MNWTGTDAENTCGVLLQSLINSIPDINWERAAFDHDDGLIYLTNSKGRRVRVKISREALKDYLDADSRRQHRKEEQLARIFARIEAADIGDGLVTSDDLSL